MSSNNSGYRSKHGYNNNSNSIKDTNTTIENIKSLRFDELIAMLSSTQAKFMEYVLCVSFM